MACVESEQMTLRSCSVLSCTCINICACTADPPEFRNGSEGAVQSGASEPGSRAWRSGPQKTLNIAGLCPWELELSETSGRIREDVMGCGKACPDSLSHRIHLGCWHCWPHRCFSPGLKPSMRVLLRKRHTFQFHGFYKVFAPSYRKHKKACPL